MTCARNNRTSPAQRLHLCEGLGGGDRAPQGEALSDPPRREGTHPEDLTGPAEERLLADTGVDQDDAADDERGTDQLDRPQPLAGRVVF